MTKADNLIEKTKEASQNYTKQFIQDYLHTKYKLPRNHVFVSLGKIIGHVNNCIISYLMDLILLEIPTVVSQH